jgi:tetratricopeptide (TPR) repeat protein
VSRPRKPWLFGPIHDALWGAGIAYLAVFVLLATVGAEVRSLFPMWAMMFLVVLVSIPHYGATLLRIYERREDRRKYGRFAAYTTILLGLVFVWGLHDMRIGSLLFTAYLTWSPWHYTGQNYGITLMLLGRQGVVVSPRVKRFLHGSFVLSFVLTFFFIHGPYTASSYRGGIQYLSIGFPAIVSDLIIFSTSLAYLLFTGAAVFALLRSGPRRTWIALTLILTQGVWFVLPAWFKNWLPYSSVEPLSTEYAQYAFTWIALGHAAQYLWITRYFARGAAEARRTSFYLPALFAGCVVWVAPAVVFAPGVLGDMPFDAGLSSLVAALVNLHHFILDGAIWKLRDSRIASILFSKDREETVGPTPIAPTRAYWRPAVATLGALSFFVLMYGNWEGEFGLRRSLARGDLPRAETAVERLSWMGRESHHDRHTLGALALSAGDLPRAQRQLEAAVLVSPDAQSWVDLGTTYERLGDWDRALSAFENALALRPDHPTAILSRAAAYVRLGDLGPARRVLASPAPARPTNEERRLREYLEERLSSEKSR